MIVLIQVCAYGGDFTTHFYMYEYNKEKLQCVITGIKETAKTR